MKLRKTLTGILGVAVMALSVGSFSHVNEHKEVLAESVFTEVTDVSQLYDGAKIIITYGDQYALSTTQNTNNRAATSFDLNKSLAEQTNIQEIILEVASESQYYLKVGDNQYLYNSDTGNNRLRTSSKNTVGDNGKFNITIDNEGAASIESVGNTSRGKLAFNPNNGTPIFNCYSDYKFVNTSQAQHKTTIYLNSGASASEEEVTSNKIIDYIDDYYNKGVYTKKTQINLSENVTGLDLIDVFHHDDNIVHLNRTTYYNNEALFMANFDGTIGGTGGINSGYKTNAETGNLDHFKYTGSEAKVDWSVKGETLNSFFVTMTKMVTKGYFEDSGWSFVNNTATYAKEGGLTKDDPYLKDFLAFTAPCLEEVVLSDKYANYFVFDKLTIKANKDNKYGDYLSLKMHVNGGNAGALNENGQPGNVLSEARIYENNVEFNEDLRDVTINLPEKGGSITSNIDTSKGVKVGSKLTFTINVDKDYELSLLKINGIDVLSDVNNGNIDWTVTREDVEIDVQFKSTAVSEDILFEFGNNGSATHADGSSASTYSETVNGYTLKLESLTNLYTGAKDAKGNSCIKLGTSKKAGSFSFTVPNDVTSVVIYVAKYKADTTKVTVNGKTYTISTASNNGSYTEISVDTTVNKQIKVSTASGGYRCMINTIQYIVE